jgi:hypothetical protein
VQAAKAQQSMTGNRSDELAEALMRALADLDGDDANDLIPDSPQWGEVAPRVRGGVQAAQRRDLDGESVSTAGCGADCDE